MWLDLLESGAFAYAAVVDFTSNPDLRWNRRNSGESHDNSPRPNQRKHRSESGTCCVDERRLCELIEAPLSKSCYSRRNLPSTHDVRTRPIEPRFALSSTTPVRPVPNELSEPCFNLTRPEK